MTNVSDLFWFRGIIISSSSSSCSSSRGRGGSSSSKNTFLQHIGGIIKNQEVNELLMVW